MIAFLNNKYKKLGSGTFLIQASILGFLSDVSAVLYLEWFGLNKYISKDLLGLSFALHGVNINSMPPEQIENYKKLLISSMGTTFTMFLAFHAIVYYMLFKNKLWAKKYLFGYTLTTFLLGFLECFFVIPKNPTWGLSLLLISCFYCYIHMGIRYFKKQEQ